MPKRSSMFVVVLTATAVIGGLAGWGTAAGAGSGITVNPDSGLANNTVVKVSATGLPGNSDFDIAECQLSVTAANPANPGPGCAPDAAQVFCTQATNGDCGIVVASHGFGTVFGTVKISFGHTTDTTKTTSSASKLTVPAGKHFAISGRVVAAGAGLNGLKVTLYRRANSHGAWAKVGSSKTKKIKGVSGSYSFGLKGLSHPERYQVRHAKQQVGATTYQASAGKLITIKP